MSGENGQGEADSSEISGKKIFFLHPTASIQNQVISELIQYEYEVYISKKQARLLHVLKKYPDSIVFINIDEELSHEEWNKWISAADKVSPDVRIGVFSSITENEKQQMFIDNPKITGGFIPLKLDMSKAAMRILEILDKEKAKGRRKYLRVATERDTNATLNLPLQGEIYNASILDISVVGASCVFHNDPEFSKNTLLKDVQIRLQTMLLKVEAIVFGSRMDKERRIYVLIFTQRTDPDVRVKIRKFIQQNLQNKMDPHLG